MKKLIALLLAAIMVFALCACGSQPAAAPASGTETTTTEPGSADPAAAALPEIEPQTVKLACIAAEESGLGKSLNKFAELVGERTNGKITVDVFLGGILGTEPEMKEMVSMNTVQMVSMGWSLLTNKLSYSIAYFGYYQMLDRDELEAFYESDTAHLFYDAYEAATGVRVIDHSFYQAPRNVMTSRPVENLEQMKGLVMRTPAGVAVDLDAWKSFGANPVGMALSECFTAFETGTIEGVELPCSYMYTYSFADAGAKYVIRSEHQIYNNLMGVNAAWWDSLPAEYQQIILQCAKEAGEYCKELEIAQEQEYIDAMVNDQGCTLIEWTPEFKAQLKELVTPVYLEQQKLAIEEAKALLGK